MTIHRSLKVKDSREDWKFSESAVTKAARYQNKCGARDADIGQNAVQNYITTKK